MKLHKVVNGQRIDLTPEETEEILAQWEENTRIAEEERIKNELEGSFPTLETKVNGLIAQIDYFNKIEHLPLCTDMQELFASYDKIASNPLYKKYKQEIAAKTPKRTAQNLTKKTEKQLFMDDINQKMEAAQSMAQDAKQSNEEITKVLQEIKDALGAIQGFMMIIPQVYQSLQALQENLKPKE